MNRYVDGEKDSFWGASDNVHATYDCLILETLQSLQLARNIEVDRVKCELTDREIGNSTRMSDELELVLASEIAATRRG